MNLSAAGVVVAVGGSLLMHFGFSQSCSNEIVQILPVLAGGVMTWWHGVSSGQHTLAGMKK